MLAAFMLSPESCIEAEGAASEGGDAPQQNLPDSAASQADNTEDRLCSSVVLPIASQHDQLIYLPLNANLASCFQEA